MFRQLGDLDALVIAHNLGEGWLPRYPDLPAVTETFLRNVAERVVPWTAAGGSTAATAVGSASARAGSGCLLTDTALAAGKASITGAVAGDPAEVAIAVQRAQVLARDRCGWLHLCDRLACRAYGYANSG